MPRRARDSPRDESPFRTSLLSAMRALWFAVAVTLMMMPSAVKGQNLMGSRHSVSDTLPRPACSFSAGGMVDWGDFDNDGDQDILFTDATNGLSIFVNNGSCGFTQRIINVKSMYTLAISNSIGTFPNTPWNFGGASFHNLNSDAFLDIFTRVYFAPYGSSSSPWYYLFAFLQGSATGDFAIVPQFTPSVGIGSESFLSDPGVWQFPAANIRTMSWPADCDRDGDTDIVIMTDVIASAPRGYALQNQGQMQFAIIQLFSSLTTDTPRMGAFTVGDINGDQIPDLLWTCLRSGTLSPLCRGRSPVIVSLGNGDCTFSSTLRAGPAINPGFAPGLTVANMSSNAAFFAPALGDCDGDGDLDVLVTGPSAGQSIGGGVMVNNGDMTFRRVPPPTGLEGLLTSQFVDVNGDGRLDIYGSTMTNTQSAIYLNQGNCTYGSPQIVTRGSQSVASGWSVWGDCDRDRDLDLLEVCGIDILSNYYDAPTSIYLNSAASILVPSTSPTPRLRSSTQSGSCTSSSPSSQDASLAPLQMSVVDMNNDGELDIVLAASAGSSVNILLQSSMNFSRVDIPAR